MIGHSASFIEPGDFDYIQGIVDRNFVGQGPLCAELRSMLATRFGRTEVILTDSATAALHLSLRVLKQQSESKSRVLVPGFVCPEVVSAIKFAGLAPVFVDSRPDSLNADMIDAARKVDRRTLAIVCTHVGGIPDDLDAAVRLGVPVISDCAQGVGALWAGRDVATQGYCSILSFGSTKMLTVGMGGALLSEGEFGRAAAQLARGELSAEEYRRDGFRVTFGQHMGDLAAGLASVQLRRLDVFVQHRRRIAECYDAALRNHKGIVLMQDGDLMRSNRFRYYFLSDQSTSWIAHLRSHGIDARQSISHLLPEYLGDLAAFPNLGRIAARVVSVPIYPAMTAAQSNQVASALACDPGRHDS